VKKRVRRPSWLKKRIQGSKAEKKGDKNFSASTDRHWERIIPGFRGVEKFRGRINWARDQKRNLSERKRIALGGRFYLEYYGKDSNKKQYELTRS